MQTTVLFGVFLFLLPLGTIGVSLRDIVKRDAHGARWNYEEDFGPSKWNKSYERCGYRKQSPINIKTTKVDFNDQLDDFEFDNYDDPLENAMIENNGHTIKITPGADDAPRSFVEGGVDDKYVFSQLHFHWGSDEKKGSEHTIDDKRFPLEMHLVHVNQNYETIEEALEKEDGLAVLGVLFKMDAEDNPALKPIIDKLKDVSDEGKKVAMDDFTLDSLLPENTMPYYRYEGSLTTPPCYEAVIWTVFTEFVPISDKQLRQFRNVEEEEPEGKEPLVNNYRNIQKIGNRVVEISGKSNTASVVGPSVVAVIAALTILL